MYYTKYFEILRHDCETYTWTGYLVASRYILRFVTNFTNIIMTVGSHLSTNEISKCFVQHAQYIQARSLRVVVLVLNRFICVSL